MFHIFRSGALASRIVAAARRPSPRWFSAQESLAPQVEDQGVRQFERLLLRSQEYQSMNTRISLKNVTRLIEVAGNIGSLSGVQSQVLLRMTGSLLHGTPATQRAALTEAVWKLTPKSERSISHFNTLLLVRNQNNQAYDPTEVITELKNMGLEPNRITFQRLVERYCVAGDVESSKKVLQFMKDQNMSVNERVFNSMISGHFKSGDVASAEKIIGIMQSLDVSPSGETYTCLALGYAESGDVPKALSIIAEHRLNDEQILSIIKSRLVVGDTQSLPELFATLPKFPRWTFHLINSCMDVIAVGKIDAALELVRISAEQIDRMISFGHIGRLLVDMNVDVKHIDTFFGIMKERNPEAYPELLLSVMRSALTTDNLGQCLNLIKLWTREEGCARSLFYYPLLANAKNDEERLSIFKSAAECGAPLRNDFNFFQYAFPDLTSESVPAVMSLVEKDGLEAIKADTIPYIQQKLLRNRDLDGCIAFVEKLDNVSVFYSIPIAENANAGNMDKIFKLMKILSSKATLPRIPVNSMSAMLKKLSPDLLPLALAELQKTDLRVDVNVLRNLGVAETVDPKNVMMRGERMGMKYNDVDPEELSKVITDMKAKPEGVPAGLEVVLARKYGAAGQFDNAIEVFENMQAEMTPPQMATLLTLHHRSGNLEKSMELYEKITALPDFQMEASKHLKQATMLLEAGKVEEGLQILQKELIYEEGLDSRIYFFLRTLTAKLGPEKALKVVEQDFAGRLPVKFVNAALEGLIVSDFEKAFSVFKKYAGDKVAVLQRYAILKTIIANKDEQKFKEFEAIMVQMKMTDVMNLDLAKIYADLDRVVEAREILRKFDYHMILRVLNGTLERYIANDEWEKFDKFVACAEGLSKVADTLLIEKRIKRCQSQGDAAKALELWMKAQDEELIVSDQTLINLAELLDKNNMAVPFLVPRRRTVVVADDEE